MAEPLPAAPESREIRVFLSSTFRDFSEERSLLATLVVPELNRRAMERGVELVEGGHAVGICLREIERCSRFLNSEHRLKNIQQLIERSLRKSPQMLDETLPVYSSQLVSHNVTVFPVKNATHAKRVWMTASCERRNDECA